MDRIIVLVDMDCFYVQVEQRANPSLKGKPCAVVQYNTWKGGGIIAVGYEARAKGVTRQMRGNDAKAKCPEIILVRVPEVRGKADLTKYREAGAEVIEVFSKFSNCVERASIDEAYVDLTEEVKKRLESMRTVKVTEDKLSNTHAIGFEVKSDEKEKAVIRQEGISNWLQSIYDSEEITEADRQLAVGAMIVEEMRAAVYEETGFRCSAGIAHNKVLAKLTCGVNKPNKQTVLPHNSVTSFFQTMPINKVRGFGGKFGEAIKEMLQVEYMAELQQFSQKRLQECFGSKSGLWVYDICRGYEHEPVSARQLAKSIGCSKNFRGREKLDTREKVKHWILSLAKEVVERLEKDRELNKRKAKSLVVGLRQDFGNDSSYSSRSCAIVKYDVQKFADDALILLSKFNRASSNQMFWDPPLLNLSMSATKFTEIAPEGSSSITCFMTQEGLPASQMPAELPGDNQKIKKTPKPKGIELFFSQPSISTKTKVNDSSLTELTSLANECDSPVGTNSKSEDIGSSTQSFFRSYLQKKQSVSSHVGNSRPSSPSQTIQSINSVVSVENGNSHLNDENSVEDFDFSANNRRNPNQLFGQNSYKDIYDADTDYSDDEIDAINVCDQFNGDSSNSSESCNKSKVKVDISNSNLTCGDAESASTSSHGGAAPAGASSGGDLVDSEDMMTCKECGESVLIWEFPEHADFHFALKLQQETKKEQKPLTLDGFPSAKRKDDTPPSARGRKKAKLNNANMNTLHTFFKP